MDYALGRRLVPWSGSLQVSTTSSAGVGGRWIVSTGLKARFPHVSFLFSRRRDR